MRRLAGAWLLFILVLSFKSGPLVQRLQTGCAPQSAGTGAAPLADRPSTPSISGSRPFSSTLTPPPSWYCSDPLFFFSTAPRDSLILLPGIGPVLADRIIDARGGKRLFKKWDDLLRVKGIGAKTVEKFKRLADAN